MKTRTANGRGNNVEAVLTGSRRVSREWGGLRAEYAWLPPFRGAAVTKPNRVEVVFSEHDDVLIDQAERTHHVRVQPGAMYVVGEQPTTLLNVGAYSDTLEMYPDQELLGQVARNRGLRNFELEPTLQRQRSVAFTRDGVVLGVAHVLRRACMNRLTIADVEADGLAQLLAGRLIAMQHGEEPRVTARRKLGRRTISRLAAFVEAGLTGRIRLNDLAHVAGLSPFHFARCFRATMGLAPHQYVQARRIELAKRLIMTTDQSVVEVAWSVGFENISHFRRQFAAQVGVLPGVLRRATRPMMRAGQSRHSVIAPG